MSKSTDSERLTDMMRMDNAMANYVLGVPLKPTRKNYVDAATELGLYQSRNQGGRHLNVDTESNLLNGGVGNTLTKSQHKVDKLLQARPFLTTPDLRTGSVPDSSFNPRSQGGVLTRHTKKNMDLAGITIDRFVPLIPEVNKSIQYREDHINPTYWERGGMDTRTVVRNTDYLKSCGKR